MRISREQTVLFLKKNTIKLLIACIGMLALSMLFGISFITVAMLTLLILIASVSTFYFNYVSAPINFELVKMSTILAAYTQGIPAGLIVGVLSTITGKVLIGRIDEKLPLSVAAISIVAILAGLFSKLEIHVLGIFLVGLYNVTLFSISMLTGGDLKWNLPYESTNFVINAILFLRIAPLLMPLIQ